MVFVTIRRRGQMKNQSFREITEDDIAAALDGASFKGWPADESELLELVNIVMDSAQAAELGQLIGAAHEPYRFLARAR
ncbi:hypothetical protein BES08_04140 [Novosphingobium resinovorum]|uniref:Uncharacterized protein n=2 Tax=Novosphingobium resinovorum TaxID=158500 RepID=A0A1D8A1M7_9SPHN|nr:hypothetical protein BES08_04140 [Novosphingobium resinovorum]